MILKCVVIRQNLVIMIYLLLLVLWPSYGRGISCEANAAVFFEEGFEAGVPQTFTSQYYGSLRESNRYTIQSMVKNSGQYALRYHFISGTNNVNEYATQHFGDSIAGPVYMNGLGNHYDDLYIQFKVYYSPRYDWSAGNNKIMIVGTQDDKPHSNVCCNPWVSHYITILAGNIGNRGFFNAEANNKKSEIGQWIGLSPNINGYNSTNRYLIEVGKWYTIEIRKKLNDVGQNNGIFEMWIDGVKITERSNILYRVQWDGMFGANFAYGTNFVMLTTYINSPAPQDQDIYYDDIKFSTTYIGINEKAISPPSNLRTLD